MAPTTKGNDRRASYGASKGNDREVVGIGFSPYSPEGNTDQSSIDARTTTDLFANFGQFFSKNLEKAGYSNHFSDFSGLDLMFAEAHARGFAPL